MESTGRTDACAAERLAELEQEVVTVGDCRDVDRRLCAGLAPPATSGRGSLGTAGGIDAALATWRVSNKRLVARELP